MPTPKQSRPGGSSPRPCSPFVVAKTRRLAGGMTDVILMPRGKAREWRDGLRWGGEAKVVRIMDGESNLFNFTAKEAARLALLKANDKNPATGSK